MSLRNGRLPPSPVIFRRSAPCGHALSTGSHATSTRAACSPSEARADPSSSLSVGPGVEEGLAATLDVGIALDRFIFEQRRDAGMGQHPLDEGSGTRPATGVDAELCIKAVLEE